MRRGCLPTAAPAPGSRTPHPTWSACRHSRRPASVARRQWQLLSVRRLTAHESCCVPFRTLCRLRRRRPLALHMQAVARAVKEITTLRCAGPRAHAFISAQPTGTHLRVQTAVVQDVRVHAVGCKFRLELLFGCSKSWKRHAWYFDRCN